MNFIRKYLLPEPVSGQLHSIFLAERAGAAMESVQSVQAVAGGLEGDRYLAGVGYWHRVESCQVTLISAHDLKLAGSGNAFDFSKGSHRRNLVVSGLKTKALEGRVFRIGEALFAYGKPRPPCGYLNKIEGRGMALALSYNSGVCLRVVQSGRLSVGDKLEIME